MRQVQPVNYNAALAQVSSWQILLQKPQIARREFSCCKISDRRSLIRLPSIALPRSSAGLSTGDEVPPHLYTRIAPKTRKIFDRQCNKDFCNNICQEETLAKRTRSMSTSARRYRQHDLGLFA
jgi:hypothetical protein